MKAKFFSTRAINYTQQKTTHPSGLTSENEINGWLQENPGLKVVAIKQSTGGSSFWSGAHIFISIWYEEEKT
jgi:hypothetical protein